MFLQCGYKVYIGPRKYFVTSDVGDNPTFVYFFLFLCYTEYLNALFSLSSNSADTESIFGPRKYFVTWG